MAIPASKVYQEYLDFKTDQTIKSFEDITNIYQKTLKECSYKDDDYWHLSNIQPSNDDIEMNGVHADYFSYKKGYRDLLIETQRKSLLKLFACNHIENGSEEPDKIIFSNT